VAHSEGGAAIRELHAEPTDDAMLGARWNLLLLTELSAPLVMWNAADLWCTQNGPAACFELRYKEIGRRQTVALLIPMVLDCIPIGLI